MANNKSSPSRRTALMNEFEQNGCSLKGYSREKALEILLTDCLSKPGQSMSRSG